MAELVWGDGPLRGWRLERTEGPAEPTWRGEMLAAVLGSALEDPAGEAEALAVLVKETGPVVANRLSVVKARAAGYWSSREELEEHLGALEGKHGARRLDEHDGPSVFSGALRVWAFQDGTRWAATRSPQHEGLPAVDLWREVEPPAQAEPDLPDELPHSVDLAPPFGAWRSAAAELVARRAAVASISGPATNLLRYALEALSFRAPATVAEVTESAGLMVRPEVLHEDMIELRDAGLLAYEPALGTKDGGTVDFPVPLGRPAGHEAGVPLGPTAPDDIRANPDWDPTKGAAPRPEAREHADRRLADAPAPEWERGESGGVSVEVRVSKVVASKQVVVGDRQDWAESTCLSCGSHSIQPDQARALRVCGVCGCCGGVATVVVDWVSRERDWLAGAHAGARADWVAQRFTGYQPQKKAATYPGCFLACGEAVSFDGPGGVRVKDQGSRKRAHADCVAALRQAIGWDPHG